VLLVKAVAHCKLYKLLEFDLASCNERKSKTNMWHTKTVCYILK
jgi:hypothetical protein